MYVNLSIIKKIYAYYAIICGVYFSALPEKNWPYFLLEYERQKSKELTVDNESGLSCQTC